MTSFVGREADLAELQAVVTSASYRCIVLTGAPGCGKSRLALEVGGRVASQFAEGVWWVDLATAEPAQAVAEIVGGVLASAGGPALDRPGAGSVLLILDNCERHTPHVSATIHRLIGINPHIRILATSSYLLPIPGGRVWPVPPLDTPPAEAASGERRGAAEEAWPVQRLLEYPSVRLFVDRAVAVSPHFVLTERHAVDVARICRRLDGLPRAIELAAAKVSILTPEEINTWLAESLRVLDDPADSRETRGRGLWESLDTSYRQLTPTEQTLFRRLTVFEGGASFEAAREVASEIDDRPVDILNRLLRLVNMSLVMVDQRVGQTQYTLLGIMREYGREQLRATGEVEATYAAHARFYVALAEQAQAALRSPTSATWLARLDQERENIEQALHTCLDTQPELGLRLVGAVWRYWEARGAYGHGRRWLDQMLARAYLFQYGQSPSYGQATAGGGASGSSPISVLAALTGLNQGPYHYRTQVQNGAGLGLGVNRWAQITAEPTNVILQAFHGAASGGAVTLTWSTAFEVDVAGFRLYRSRDANDGYQGVGPALIPSLLEPAGASYSWTDAGLAQGGWYYMLEAVSSTGQTVDAAGPVLVQAGAAPIYHVFLPIVEKGH